MKDEFEVIRKLSEVIDLGRECNVDGITRIWRRYIGIRETEFGSLKDDIIEECADRLGRLAHDKTASLSGGEYFVWLQNMLRMTQRHEVVHAISVMLESAWTEIPAELQYLEANVTAARRGVRINRLFITTQKRLQDGSNREVLRHHVQHAHRGLRAYVALEEELTKIEPILLQEAGKGFVQFGDRVALMDTGVPPGEVSGLVTMNGHQLRQNLRLFERLRVYARVVDDQFLKHIERGWPGRPETDTHMRDR